MSVLGKLASTVGEEVVLPLLKYSERKLDFGGKAIQRTSVIETMTDDEITKSPLSEVPASMLYKRAKNKANNNELKLVDGFLTQQLKAKGYSEEDILAGKGNNEPVRWLDFGTYLDRRQDIIQPNEAEPVYIDSHLQDVVPDTPHVEGTEASVDNSNWMIMHEQSGLDVEEGHFSLTESLTGHTPNRDVFAHARFQSYDFRGKPKFNNRKVRDTDFHTESFNILKDTGIFDEPYVNPATTSRIVGNLIRGHIEGEYSRGKTLDDIQKYLTSLNGKDYNELSENLMKAFDPENFNLADKYQGKRVLVEFENQFNTQTPGKYDEARITRDVPTLTDEAVGNITDSNKREHEKVARKINKYIREFDPETEDAIDYALGVIRLPDTPALNEIQGLRELAEQYYIGKQTLESVFKLLPRNDKNWSALVVSEADRIAEPLTLFDDVAKNRLKDLLYSKYKMSKEDIEGKVDLVVRVADNYIVASEDEKVKILEDLRIKLTKEVNAFNKTPEDTFGTTLKQVKSALDDNKKIGEEYVSKIKSMTSRLEAIPLEEYRTKDRFDTTRTDNAIREDINSINYQLSDDLQVDSDNYSEESGFFSGLMEDLEEEIKIYSQGGSKELFEGAVISKASQYEKDLINKSTGANYSPERLLEVIYSNIRSPEDYQNLARYTPNPKVSIQTAMENITLAKNEGYNIYKFQIKDPENALGRSRNQPSYEGRFLRDRTQLLNKLGIKSWIEGGHLVADLDTLKSSKALQAKADAAIKADPTAFGYDEDKLQAGIEEAMSGLNLEDGTLESRIAYNMLRAKADNLVDGKPDAKILDPTGLERLSPETIAGIRESIKKFAPSAFLATSATLLATLPVVAEEITPEQYKALQNIEGVSQEWVDQHMKKNDLKVKTKPYTDEEYQKLLQVPLAPGTSFDEWLGGLMKSTHRTLPESMLRKQREAEGEQVNTKSETGLTDDLKNSLALMRDTQGGFNENFHKKAYAHGVPKPMVEEFMNKFGTHKVDKDYWEFDMQNPIESLTSLFYPDRDVRFGTYEKEKPNQFNALQLHVGEDYEVYGIKEQTAQESIQRALAQISVKETSWGNRLLNGLDIFRKLGAGGTHDSTVQRERLVKANSSLQASMLATAKEAGVDARLSNRNSRFGIKSQLEILMVNPETGEEEYTEITPDLWDSVNASAFELMGAVGVGVASYKGTSGAIDLLATRVPGLASAAPILKMGAVATTSALGEAGGYAVDNFRLAMELDIGLDSMQLASNMGQTFLAGLFLGSTAELGLKSARYGYNHYGRYFLDKPRTSFERMLVQTGLRTPQQAKAEYDVLEGIVKETYPQRLARIDKPLEFGIVPKEGKRENTEQEIAVFKIAITDPLMYNRLARASEHSKEPLVEVAQMAQSVSNQLIKASLSDYSMTQFAKDFHLQKLYAKYFYRGTRKIGIRNMADTEYSPNIYELSIRPALDEAELHFVPQLEVNEYRRLYGEATKYGAKGNNFEALLNLKQVVGEVASKVKKDKPSKSLNAAKASIDAEIKRAAIEYMPPGVGQAWWDVWRLSERHYSQTKTMLDTKLAQRMMDGDNSEPQLAEYLASGYASVGDVAQSILPKFSGKTRIGAESALWEYQVAKHTDKDGLVDVFKLSEEGASIGYTTAKTKPKYELAREIANIFPYLNTAGKLGKMDLTQALSSGLGTSAEDRIAFTLTQQLWNAVWGNLVPSKNTQNLIAAKSLGRTLRDNHFSLNIKSVAERLESKFDPESRSAVHEAFTQFRKARAQGEYDKKIPQIGDDASDPRNKHPGSDRYKKPPPTFEDSFERKSGDYGAGFYFKSDDPVYHRYITSRFVDTELLADLTDLQTLFKQPNLKAEHFKKPSVMKKFRGYLEAKGYEGITIGNETMLFKAPKETSNDTTTN